MTLPVSNLFLWVTLLSFTLLLAGTATVLWYMLRLYRNRQDVRRFPMVFASMGFYVAAPVFTNIATVISLFQPIVEVELSLLLVRGLITAVTAVFVVFIYPRLLKIPTQQQLQEEYQMYQARKRISLEGQITTRNGKITEVNPKACLIYGYTEEEFLQINMLDLVYPEDRDMIVKHRAMDYKEKYACRGLNKKGEVLYLEVRGENVRYHGANERITAIKDLTKEKALAEKLKEDIKDAITQLETKEFTEATNQTKQRLLDNWKLDGS